jgi:hypothetical protein
MTDPHPRAAPSHPAVQLDRGLVVRPRDHPDPYQPDSVREWQAHLDAGRLGRPRRATPPDVLANREATEELFRRIAADRAEARRRAGW